MKLARVFSGQPHITTPSKITVETDISNGLHSFIVIGLPDKAVEESRDRVGAAIKNSGLTSPKTQNQKVVVSLSPAELKKEGSIFDVPIAISYLIASNQIQADVSDKMFLGELSLSGEILPVKGVLSIAKHAQEIGIRQLFVPEKNKTEASLISDVEIYGVSNLKELISHIGLNPTKNSLLKKEDVLQVEGIGESPEINFRDIKSNEVAKRALLIAAAGRHNITLFGPPGTGKTMLARAFPYILPTLSRKEIIEVSQIHSVAGTLIDGIKTSPPFRSPHHTSSHVALVGGGSNLRPGEITLAHKGVLFLDEFPEFDAKTLESLREPLEEGSISISRAKGTVRFPADVLLIAAMNPCPCGFKGSLHRRCVCRENDLARYSRKISGPIIDRIDMWVEVSNIPYEELLKKDSTEREETSSLQEKVCRVREIQKRRFNTEEKTNSKMKSGEVETFCKLNVEEKNFFDGAAKKLQLSPRGYFKVLKLARTIADLDESVDIQMPHLLEALQYRPKLD